MNIEDTLKILKSSVEIILPKDGLEEQLRKSKKEQRPLRVKLGFDPTAPDLHLGHAVVLKKLKDFQDLGHQIIIIIGDFTACIGDPTGKNKTRPPLQKEQVKHNAETYLKQLSKVLDLTKVEVCYNAEWYDKFSSAEFIKLLSKMTVAQVMQRTDFRNRYDNQTPISLHEIVYPLLQGYDSLVIDADIEIGGTDQLFNCTVGRQIQEAYDGQNMQTVLCMPLLKGIDGEIKMSKSENNYIGLTEDVNSIFGKTMSIPDSLLPEYIALVTDYSLEEKNELLRRLQSDENPMIIKKEVAKNIICQYHSEPQSIEAEKHFNQQFSNKIFEEKEFVEISITSLNVDKKNDINVIALCKLLKPNESNSNLRRLIEGGGVTINNVKVEHASKIINLNDGDVKIKIGKRDFFKIIC